MNVKKALFLYGLFPAAFLFFGQVAHGQTDSSERPRRYHVNYVTGSVIIGVGLGTDAFAISRIKDKPDLSDAELQALNPGSVNSFDRWALHQDPSNYLHYSKLSDILEPPLFILLPAMLGLDKKIPKKEWLDILFMYIEGHTITFTFYNYSWLGPTAHDRFRPLTYYTQLPLSARKNGGNRNSFYSGHTASVAFTSFFVAKVFCDYHPDLGFGKYLVYTAALIPPGVMGYFRVRSLAHFPSDALVGLGLGAMVGIVVPAIHKTKYKGVALNLFSTPAATGLDLCWTIPDHGL
ncbi:MAG TPA: phosphatase PAP2 family protein [Puia sp.]|nr:phosphatase PAP2 family protein [Puia sp.]